MPRCSWILNTAEELNNMVKTRQYNYRYCNVKTVKNEHLCSKHRAEAQWQEELEDAIERKDAKKALDLLIGKPNADKLEVEVLERIYKS